MEPEKTAPSVGGFLANQAGTMVLHHGTRPRQMSVGDYKPALGDSWTEEECDDDDDGAQSGEEEIEAMGDSHVQVHSVAPSRPPAPHCAPCTNAPSPPAGARAGGLLD